MKGRPMRYPALVTLPVGGALEVPATHRADRTVERAKIHAAAYYLRRTQRGLRVRIEDTPAGVRAVRVA